MTRAGKWGVGGAVAFLLLASVAGAAEAPKAGGVPPGHGAVGGAAMQGGMQGGHAGMGGMDMGEKVGGGAFGPWKCAIYLSDSRKALEHAKAQGAKVDMNLSHHVMLMLLTQEGPPVLEGKGTVTVTGPGAKGKKYNLIPMQGQFGADVPMAKPGKYTLKLTMESGKSKGEKTVTAVVK